MLSDFLGLLGFLAFCAACVGALKLFEWLLAKLGGEE